MATNTLPSQAPATVIVPKPYVGLRPFERSERSIFFGRGRDASFLVDKIFSAKVTLLYAPSGVGKSSILRTLVVPQLEDERARVVYFDAWSGADPAAALSSALAQLASQLGVPDAGRGAPTLAELVGLLSSVDDRTVVLILDQFEEFLVNHSHHLDPLRTELAVLTRTTLDVRVVLSLRQEFLAALEPFRNLMLNLFQSTYLLENLDEKGVRDAIEGPLALFGGKYEQALVDQLVRDLRAQENESLLPGAALPVDLPTMQLVCEQLWSAAPKQEPVVLSLALYKDKGEAAKILDAYVRGVMPPRWSARLLTAKLMKSLAPRSGFKRSYSAAELADSENLNQASVTAELQRLSSHLILRTREYRGQKLFELQHDAFIRIIAPWRDSVLRRAKAGKRVLVAAVVFLSVVAASLLGYRMFARERLEIDANTKKVMSELQKMPADEQSKQAELHFDFVTTYLLKRKQYDKLKELLEENESLLPAAYGVNRAEAEETTTVPLTGAAGSHPAQVFCLQYSSQRPLDQTYFNQEWRRLAKYYFASQLGMPVPSQLKLLQDASLPKLEVRLLDCSKKEKPKEGMLLDRAIPSYERNAVVLSSELGPEGMEFLKRFGKGKDWSFVPWEGNERLWIVPNWSRPVWKVSNSPAMPGSALPALLLASELRQNAEVLLKEGGAALIIDRLRPSYPQTVQEAVAARGDRLTKDFAEILKRGLSLRDPIVILEELSLYPTGDSAKVAERVDADMRAAQPNFPARLRGPSKSMGDNASAQMPAVSRDTGGSLQSLERSRGNSRTAANAVRNLQDDVYQEVIPFLPRDGRPIHVYLGKDLRAAWDNADQRFGKLGEIHDNLFRELGVLPGTGLIATAPENDRLGAADFQIMSIGGSDPECNRKVTSAGLENAFGQLAEVVRQCAEKYAMYWVTADEVVRQRGLTNAEFRSWLASKYSVADQRLLMRAVLFHPGSDGSGTANGTNGYTIRYPGWLLCSLVFWAQIDDVHDTMKMAQRLRDTQRARTVTVPSEGANQELRRLITEGITAVREGRIPAAEASFGTAERSYPETAVKEFLSQYPQTLPQIQLERFLMVCSTGSPFYVATVSVQQRIDLDDFLAKNGNLAEADDGRHLRMCLLSNSESQPHAKKAAIQAELLRGYNNPESWRAQEARWMAEDVLKDFDANIDPPDLREAAVQLLISAMAENRKDALSVEDSRDLFDKQVNMLDKPGPKRWRWQLLDGLVKVRPDTKILVSYAWWLSAQERPEYLERALQVADQVKARLQRNSADPDRVWEMENEQWARAKALEGLAVRDPRYGNPRDAEAVYKRLKQSAKTPGVRRTAELALLDDELADGQYAKVIAELQGVSRPSPDFPELYYELLLAQLLSGKKAEAAATAEESAEKADEADEEHRKDLLWVAAVGQLFTNTGNFEETSRKFLGTNHDYVPYIAMILATRMTENSQTSEDTQSVLKESIVNVDRSLWGARLREGDDSAWREMLIAYYLKQVSRDQIFGELDDEQRYNRSDLRFVLWREGQLCEAYFYDALLAEAEGDRAREQADLQRVLRTKARNYTEFVLAEYLVSQEHPGP